MNLAQLRADIKKGMLISVPRWLELLAYAESLEQNPSGGVLGSPTGVLYRDQVNPMARFVTRVVAEDGTETFTEQGTAKLARDAAACGGGGAGGVLGTMPPEASGDSNAPYPFPSPCPVYTIPDGCEWVYPGFTYNEFRHADWSDEQLIMHGMMQKKGG